MEQYNFVGHGGPGQGERRARLARMLRESPIPDGELLLNTGLYLVPQTLSRILFMDFLYRKILEVQGVAFDFGARWGQNSSLFIAMRSVYEPYNRLRKVVTFDTFAGFPDVSTEDGDGGMMAPSSYAVTEGYEEYLAALLAIQEAEAPLEHIKKHEIVKGDATVEIGPYLERNPETIVALAYFDFDLYKPTKDVLLAIRDRLTKGSVLGFDELNDHETPGETRAVMEVLGLGNYAVKRFPYNSRTSYLVVE
jgi:hypothetical protein